MDAKPLPDERSLVTPVSLSEPGRILIYVSLSIRSILFSFSRARAATGNLIVLAG